MKNVFGGDAGSFYQEINPILNTDTRISGINAILSQLGYKIGFSNGYFVFNEKTGMVTATQVEADDRRTIQFIKDVRDKLECCLNDTIYALNTFADLYGIAPDSNWIYDEKKKKYVQYIVNYDFGDFTYNREEDRIAWYSYVNSGHVTFWRYLVKFYGYTEEEAKKISQEAKEENKTRGFFEEE